MAWSDRDCEMRTGKYANRLFLILLLNLTLCFLFFVYDLEERKEREGQRENKDINNLRIRTKKGYIQYNGTRIDELGVASFDQFNT